MLNEIRQENSADARGYLCPSTVKAGDPVLIGGNLPAVAVDDYNPNTGGTTFRISGTFALTVIAATVVSPVTGSDVNQGDKIYATGTLDSTTNVTTGLTLSKASGGTLFGSYDSTTKITSGQTSTTAAVKLRRVV
jgi:predicted RecA/RadA family phage recombinase